MTSDYNPRQGPPPRPPIRREETDGEARNGHAGPKRGGENQEENQQKPKGHEWESNLKLSP
jgi:hypothetical protein